MKKVYFAGAIKGGQDTITEIYPSIIELMKQYFQVLSEHINRGKPTDLTAEQVFQRDIDMIQEADIVIAEVSTPSHGVGREIAYAQYNCKIPVYLLHQKDKNISFMLQGNKDITKDNICLRESLNDIKDFFEKIK